ncbi:MAG: helix-turn-helix domain-containing protein [Candidatus Aminicenantes bacterium]|nr:helix-turn-helix domain-containing protein [Candidatus Aminicenantes bacterium]
MTITQEDLARRLRQARESAGLSQEKVASALHLSRPAIAQIEAGKRKVSSIELVTLARLYGRPLQSFFEEAFEAEGISYIMRAIPEINEQSGIKKALNRGMEVINSIFDLEDKLGLERMRGVLLASYSKRIDTKWDAIKHGQEIAAQERRRLNLGTAPITNPANILELQGILILGLKLPPGISGFTFHTGQAIVCTVNASEPPVRQRYSLIHEYCHALCDIKDLPAIVTRAKEGKNLREVRADVFAANFLMPEEAIKNFLLSRGKGNPSRIQIQVVVKDEILNYEARRPEKDLEINYLDVVQMAGYFGVSVESVIWRLYNLRFINEKEREELLDKDKSDVSKVVKKYFDQKNALSGKRNRFIFQHASERLVNLAIEAARLGLISRNKLIELLKLAGLPEKDIFKIPEARRT